MFLEIIGLGILLLFFLKLKNKRLESQWSYPPGPSGLPYFSNIFSLVSSTPAHIQYSRWADIYGGVYTVKILGKKMLVVSCPKLMRQFFCHPATAGKADLEPIFLLAGGKYGITATQGEVWSEQRRFCVRTLRQFGMGKRSEIQTTILSEAKKAVEWMKKEAQDNDGVIASPIDLFKTVTSNTLWKIVRGKGYALDDGFVRNLTTDFSDSVNLSFKRGIGMCSWLKWVAPQWSGYNAVVDSTDRLRKYICEQFEEHQRKRDNAEGSNKEPKDMMDAYLNQMEVKAEDKNSSFYGENGWKNSLAVMGEMFAGGGESTPYSLNWLLLHLCHKQEVQKKLQEEIDTVLGTQDPELADKSRMPYTEAVILEALRRSPAFPLTFAHKLTENVENLGGYRLPKGTLLISNIYHAHLNKEFWGDPENFRPERFLLEKGTSEELIQERRASVVAFNVGKRACPGEPLAMDGLFLFAVKLFQAFDILPYPENGQPDFDSTEPFIMTAKPFGVIVKERK